MIQSLKAMFLVSTVLLPLMASAKSFEVPMDVRPSPMMDAGEIYVECGFLGFIHPCKIDTGAAITSISDTDNLDRLQAFPNKVGYTSMTGAKIDCDLYELPLIGVGPYAIARPRAIHCPVVDRKTETNLLGWNFLGEQPIRVNYAKKTFELNAAPSSVPLQDFANKDDKSWGHVVIPVSFGRKNPELPTKALVDTGAMLTLVDIKLARKHPELFEVVQNPATGQDTHGNEFDSVLMMITSLQMGQARATVAYVMAVDFTAIQKEMGPEVQVLLGHNILKSATWYIDYEHKKWAAE